MKATARRTSPTSYTHRIVVRQHELTADEPPELGGEDEGPGPQELLAASLAACTAITIEMYAERKGWELAQAEVEVSYETPDPGEPTAFELVLRLPAALTEEQVQRLEAIAAKCPVHRTLEGQVTFAQRVQRA